MNGNKSPDTSRRDFIRIVGSAGIIAAAGGSAFSCARVPQQANAPWREIPGGDADIRVRALSYALLAPNPHNRQPWLVDLAKPEEIVLYCDRERLLPETDPYARQIVIGHGCFLELLSIAARQFGHEAQIEVFPNGEFSATGVDGRPVARVRLKPRPGLQPDPLFAMIPRRRTNKEPYDTGRPVSPATMERLQAALPPGKGLRLVTTSAQADLAKLRGLIWEGMKLEISTPRTYMESVNLMRIGRSEILANPDGIDLGGTMIEFGRLFGMVSREALADPNSSAYQMGLDQQKDLADTAMAFGWLIAPGNSRSQQIESGRAYARINLMATQLDLDIHPWSQVLQEYPEMRTLQELFLSHSGQRPGEHTQMLFRMGHGPATEPSPRRPLKALLRA